MALNFPTNPVDGQVYTSGTLSYQWKISTNTWVSVDSITPIAAAAFAKANGAAQNAFGTIVANGTSLVADSNNDTLTIRTTGNVAITADAAGDNLTFDLTTTGVTAGVYGNSTIVPVVTVDSRGRLTTVSNTTIDTSIAVAAFNKANTSGGGGANFNTSIANSVGYAVTTSMANAYVAPSTSGYRYIVHSVHITNIGTANGNVSGNFWGTTYANTSFANSIPVPSGSAVELLKKPKVMQPSDALQLQEHGTSVELHATLSYEIQLSTSYFGSGVDITADATYTDLYTATGNAVIESILLSNDSDLYDVKARVVWTDGSNNIQGYFCYDLIIPLQSTVELLETPKNLPSGYKIRVYANVGGRLEAIIAGKLI